MPIIGLFYIWNPDELKRMIWDLISMLFIFIQLLTVPLILAYEVQISDGFNVKYVEI